MNDFSADHTQHYTAGSLDDAVAIALATPITGDCDQDLQHLAKLDQFHTGGMEATRALAERAAITAADHVLDIGGGLGGSARLLAHVSGCRMTVLDLTEAYCRAGERLTAWVGLSDRVQFQHGNALNMPFDDGSFDLAWMQHSSMNIADKACLYAEIQRVLRPGGRLALYEVVAGRTGQPHYPAFWARNAATSFLVTADVLRTIVANAGFRELHWRDTSAWALEWLAARRRVLEPAGETWLAGLPLVLGPAFGSMAQNHARNLQEGRIQIVEGVFTRQ